MRKSTLTELENARSLVKSTETEIIELVRQGHLVHMVFDFDHVLADGRSDDVFDLLGEVVESYHTYEDRLLLQAPYDGPWAETARKCGSLHHSQDIATARTTYTPMRVMLYNAKHRIMVRRQLTGNDTSKIGAYEGIFKWASSDPRRIVYVVDDSTRHIADCRRVAEEVGMGDRVRTILSPRIRLYTEEELRAHYEAVMDPNRKKPFILYEGALPGGKDYHYSFLVMPSGKIGFSDEIERMAERVREESAIADSRDELIAAARADNPTVPLTEERIQMVWRLLHGQ